MPPITEEGADEAPEPFETRHRTRDGRVLAVEVWTRDIDLGGQRAVLVFASDVTERRALGSALIDAIANEQRRIGQELHDGLGQELTGLALSARALATRAERERQPIAAGLVQLAALAASCIQAARRIAQGVSPLSDADGNLPVALEAMAARSSGGSTVVLFQPASRVSARPRYRGPQSSLPDCSGGRAERVEACRGPNHRDRAVGARTSSDLDASTTTAWDCRGPARRAAASACAPCNFGRVRSAADSLWRRAAAAGYRWPARSRNGKSRPRPKGAVSAESRVVHEFAIGQGP